MGTEVPVSEAMVRGEAVVTESKCLVNAKHHKPSPLQDNSTAHSPSSHKPLAVNIEAWFLFKPEVYSETLLSFPLQEL
jgi:hypothetical protein